MGTWRECQSAAPARQPIVLYRVVTDREGLDAPTVHPLLLSADTRRILSSAIFMRGCQIS